MAFLRLIRYQNLLMLALMQLIFRYGFLKWYDIPLALADWQYILLVVSTLCIAAGGYLINNIQDQETDRDNRPDSVIVGNQISEARAYNYYFAFNAVGVLIGCYLSLVIEKFSFSMLFMAIVLLLYIYATSLKQNLLIGNFIIAALLSGSVLIIGVFDLYPAVSMQNQDIMALVFKIIIDYAVFGFIINFLREIVKDLEDVNGDYNQGMNTLPIVLGVARTSILVFWLSFVPIGILLYYIYTYFIASNLFIVSGYSLVMVVAPLVYFSVSMFSAKTQKDFNHLASVLKFVMLFGILSVSVLTYNIMNA